MRLVNGRPTKVLVEVTNNEDNPISVASLAGAVTATDALPDDAPAYRAILRNLTAVKYDLAVEAGESKALPYSFALDMQPQDVRLQIMAVITNAKGELFRIPVHNDTTTIVEAPTSFFDSQMYVVTPRLLSVSLSAVPAKPWRPAQHLPLRGPLGRLRRHPLLCLQDVDRGPLPPGQARQSAQEEQKGGRRRRRPLGPRVDGRCHWRHKGL